MEDKFSEQIHALPFKANGAGLTLAAAAAGNIFKGGSAGFDGILTLPAWFFLAGLIFAYATFAISGQLQLRRSNLETVQSFRRTATDCLTAPHQTDELREIAQRCEADAIALEKAQFSEQRAELFAKSLNYLLNSSLACFCIGVVIGLVVLAAK